MNNPNHDIADSKGFLVNLLSIIGKLFAFVPAVLLSGYQAIKGKYLGGWWWMLGYARDCFGNVLIGPHANAKWIPKNGYKFGKVEPISKALAINLYQGTYFLPMIKWVKLTELDKNHMAKTLRSHKPDFDQSILNQRFIEMEIKRKEEKPHFMNRFKVPIMLLFYLGIGIPLTYHTFPNPICIGFLVVMPIFIYLVSKKK